MYRDLNTSTDYPELNEDQVVDLMKSSNSEDEWNANCDKVKMGCSGGRTYPSFWYSAIVMSGVARETAAKWGSDAEIKINTLEIKTVSTLINRHE